MVRELGKPDLVAKRPVRGKHGLLGQYRPGFTGTCIVFLTAWATKSLGLPVIQSLAFIYILAADSVWVPQTGIASPVTWASAFGYFALKISWFRLFTGPGGRFGAYLRISRSFRPTLAFWVLAGSCSCASVRRSESHHFTLPCSKLEPCSSPDQKSVSSVS